MKITTKASGTYTACACMGPQGNDPVCPCHMRAMGKEPTNTWTPEKLKELDNALAEVFGWKQEPLGEPFQSILNENLWDLYEK